MPKARSVKRANGIRAAGLHPTNDPPYLAQRKAPNDNDKRPRDSGNGVDDAQKERTTPKAPRIGICNPNAQFRAARSSTTASKS